MANTGVFNIDDINFLRDNQQYPSLGQLELIETQVASSVTYLDFVNIKEDKVTLVVKKGEIEILKSNISFK